MRTLGIDLASQPARTAACAIDWSCRPAAMGDPVLGLDDEALVDLVADADKVGIDSPFGWPDEFVAAVSAHASGGPWPETPIPQLRYRLTDLFVTDKARRPLSVSTDLVGVTAMRCARLLAILDQRIGDVDRAGGGRIAEVYPAAALAVWGFDPTGYKRVGGKAKREQLVTQIHDRTTRWLEWPPAALERCVRSDDCLDAVIAALVARAAAQHLTEPPASDQLDRARREGWIHLPRSGSLEALHP